MSLTFALRAHSGGVLNVAASADVWLWWHGEFANPEFKSCMALRCIKVVGEPLGPKA